MGRRGQRMYQCGECKGRSYHHWIERNRAARMRCPGCGSARLELVSDEAKKEAAEAQQVRVDGHASMTTPPARPNRKVT